MYSAKVKLQAILRDMSPEVMANSSILATIDVKADLLRPTRRQLIRSQLQFAES